jgi:predicted aldo/keto reductase-like oxidoreductase
MQYRKLGTTGLDVSIIGIGPEHLVRKPYSQVEEVIHGALDRGINIMDCFMPQEEIRTDIGKALKGRRDKMIIQGPIGSHEKDGQFDMTRDLPTAKKNFEDLMRHLETDYIDLGMLFLIDTEDDFNGTFDNGLADYAIDLKKKGVIRNIGFGSHNPVMAKRVIETGIIDVMFFSINPGFDLFPSDFSLPAFMENGFDKNVLGGINPQRMDLYRLCEQRGIGITVMKSYGAGRLLSAEQSPFARPLTPGQCIHFALTRPAVASVMVGVISNAEIEAACDYLYQTDEQRDYSDAVSEYQRDFTGNCVYCGHCQPCPVGIDVAAVTKYLDIAKMDENNIPETIRSHYLNLPHKGTECISCGYCEGRCPFSVKAMANMEKAQAIFGK